MIKMDMDKTEKNQEKFTCGKFEYQVIRSARKTMTLEVRRDYYIVQMMQNLQNSEYAEVAYVI